jgi:hypothetical protein
VSKISHTDHLDHTTSIHTELSLSKKTRDRERRRKLAAKHETISLAAGKKPYRTVGDALKSRSRIARDWGNRFRRLRPYKEGGRWFLTRKTKGQYQGSAARRRVLPLACARMRDHARAGAS